MVHFIYTYQYLIRNGGFFGSIATDRYFNSMFPFHMIFNSISRYSNLIQIFRVVPVDWVDCCMVVFSWYYFSLFLTTFPNIMYIEKCPAFLYIYSKKNVKYHFSCQMECGDIRFAKIYFLRIHGIFFEITIRVTFFHQFDNILLCVVVIHWKGFHFKENL